jgi:hypothetical protein
VPLRLVAAAVLALGTGLLGLPAHAQFEARSNFYVSSTDPQSVIVGNFDQDGVPDLAVLGAGATANVEILLGNGDGTFRLGSSYETKDGLYGSTASLRGNGILDLVFGGLGTDDVYVMLGNGDGTFQPPAAYAASAESQMIALGDFTGSGNLDVADLEGASTQGVSCDCIEVLPGNGDGTFGAPISKLTVPYNITGVSISAGDFNDDGNLDIAVGGFFGFSRKVDILLGNGNGSFTPERYYELGASPTAIAMGYFTPNKSKLDMALTNDTTIDVMLGNGEGAFHAPVLYDTWFPSWVVALDLNGDGKIDLAASNAGSPPTRQPGVTVFDGNGDGTFQQGVFYPVGVDEGGQFVAAGDFNGDGKPDLVVVNAVNGYITTLLNTGVAHFSPTTPLNFKDQEVGTTSRPQTVTLTNSGTSELKISSMKISTEYKLMTTCEKAVAPGANCAITATFSPTVKGPHAGTISIIDSASSKPQVIELLGTGT